MKLYRESSLIVSALLIPCTSGILHAQTTIPVARLGVDAYSGITEQQSVATIDYSKSFQVRWKVDGPAQTGQADTYAVVVALTNVDGHLTIDKAKPGAIMLAADDDKAYFEPGVLTFTYDFTNWSGSGSPVSQTTYTYQPPTPAQNDPDALAAKQAMEWLLGKVFPVAGDVYALSAILSSLTQSQQSSANYTLTTELSSNGDTTMYTTGPQRSANIVEHPNFTDDRFFDTHVMAWDTLRGGPPGAEYVMYVKEVRYTFKLMRTDSSATRLWVRAQVPYFWFPGGFGGSRERYVELERAVDLTGAEDQQATQIFRDDFNGGLTSGWTCHNEVSQNMQYNADSLRIFTQRGDNWTHFNSLHNVLVRAPGSADFEIETKLTMRPSRFNQMGGIVVQESVDHYLRISRAYRGSQRQTIWFTYEKDGKPVKDVAVKCNLQTLYLRIRKSGSTYIGSYSNDGSTWTKVAEHTGVMLEYPQVGVFATDGDYDSTSRLPVDFDYFTVSKF